MTTRPSRGAAVRSAGLLLAVSAVAVVVGATLVVRSGSAEPVPTPSSSLAEADEPSVSAPTARQTAPSDGPAPPARFVVPGLDLDLPVVPVGVAADGQMALPPRPTKIGWYEYGPAPGGEGGSAVLAGHVDSDSYGVGPLASLRQVERGDRVVVTDQDGQALPYRVTRTETIAKQAVALDKVFARGGAPRLRIVTCGGSYLPDEGGYQDNVVVTAVPIQD